MEKELVFAGFGGQGVLTSGLIAAEIALEHDLNVTWMPSYGPSMRGGKAYSVVKYSDGVIGGPDIEEVDCLVAMNEPSLDFCANVKEGGVVIINTAAADPNVKVRDDLQVVKLNCTDLAMKANNPKAPNIVALGAMIAKSQIFDKDECIKIMNDYFTGKGKGKFNDANAAAFMEGYNAAL